MRNNVEKKGLASLKSQIDSTASFHGKIKISPDTAARLEKQSVSKWLQKILFSTKVFSISKIVIAICITIEFEIVKSWKTLFPEDF